MDKTTEQFANYAHELHYTDLTTAAVHAAKRVMVDAMGCAIGAFHAAPLQAVRELAAQFSAQKPATVLGTRIRTTPDMAALASGAAIRYTDFSDDYFGGSGDTGPHPSDNIGGVLAAAETAGADGRALILGLAIAYEASAQMVDLTSLRVAGWDYPVFHSLATALAAARILGLSPQQTADAVSLAVVPNICLCQTRRGHLSNWKGFAGPNGSRNGLFAALLAQHGITGPGEPFEGAAGFMKQLNAPFQLPAFGGGGRAFGIERTFFKYLPVRYSVQLLVWAAIELGRKVKPEEIKAMCVFVEDRSVVTPASTPEYWDPHSRETADHSSPYLVGAGLVDGEINARTFTPERYRDPVLLALVRKIRLAGDAEYTAAFPQNFRCRIEATLYSGEVVVVAQSNPKGHPANPMSDQELEEKFLRQVEGIIAQAQARALLDRLWALDELQNMEELLTLARVE